MAGSQPLGQGLDGNDLRGLCYRQAQQYYTGAGEIEVVAIANGLAERKGFQFGVA